MMEERKPDTHDWLYPEILSHENLVDTLRQRYIKHVSLEQLPKEELIELYYKYVIPLPQRKYRLNRRGREMTKKQVAQAKKRKYFSKDETEPPLKKSTTDSNSTRLLTSFSGVGERLKPPPSCIDFNRKTIKLSSNSDNAAKDRGIRSMKNNDLVSDTSGVNLSETNEPKSGKKEIVKISFSSSSSTSESNSKLSSPSKEGNLDMKKTINLIDKHLNVHNIVKEKSQKNTEEKISQNNRQEEEMETSETEAKVSKKKQKFTKISWP